MAEEAIPASAPSQDNPKDAPTETEQPPKEAAEVPSYRGTKHKVKIDDKEEEILYEDLIRDYQKGKAGDKKLREAAQLRQQVEQVLQNLKSGSHQNLVKLLGKQQAKKLAEELLLEEIEYDELPDHEKKIRNLQKEKDALEKEKQEQETQRQTLERQRLEQQVGQQLEQEIVQAIQASKFKVSPRLVGRMAEVMDAYITKTKQRLPAAEALKIVRGDIPNDLNAYVDSLSDDELTGYIKSLPKRLMDAIRKGDVQTVLSQTSVSKGRDQSENPPAKKSKESDRRMSTDNWFDKMEKRFAGG